MKFEALILTSCQVETNSIITLLRAELSPDSAIQMSEEWTLRQAQDGAWNSEDTQQCSFKVFFALGMALHWATY